MIIYAICLVLGLMFTLIMAIMGHLFGGHDVGGAGGHADGGFDADGVTGTTFFSPTILGSFVTAFGAFGLIFSEIKWTQSVWLHAPLSFIGALAISLLVLWLLNKMFRLTEGSSEGRVAKLIGQTAAIVTPIPADGVGEISYEQSGSRYTAPAREVRGRMVASGQTVKISRIVGSQFFVVAED